MAYCTKWQTNPQQQHLVLARKEYHLEKSISVIDAIVSSAPKNETDVRETIIRPLLHELGYRQGTRADIETERALRYDKHFLGRKKSTDQDLQGRADYILSVVGVASWVVEAKSPQTTLTQEDVHQAHTYAAHPEINASLFLLTNGVEFWLYRTSLIGAPVLAFNISDLGSKWSDLLALLSPEAIEKYYVGLLQLSSNQIHEAGPGIAVGLGPQVKLSGGWVLYSHVEAKSMQTHRLLSQQIGSRAIVANGAAYRASDGRLHAEVRMSQPHATLDELATLMNLDWFHFECAEQCLSSNPLKPSILTGQSRGSIPPNADLSAIPGVPKHTRLPFPIHFVNDMRASGFVEGDKFKGQIWYRATYSIDFRAIPPIFHAQLKMALDEATHAIWGDFDLTFANIDRAELGTFLRNGQPE